MRPSALVKPVLLAMLTTLAISNYSSSAQPTPTASWNGQTWVASWGASQQVPEPQNALAPDDLRDSTLRQLFHLSVGGSSLRVHISNAFGREALHLTSVHVARPVSTSSPQIDPGTDHVVTFDGKQDITVPPGAEFISDAVRYSVAPLSDIAVSFHISGPPTQQTGHPGSRATSYFIHGDLTSAPTFTQPAHVDHWYMVSAIDVQAAPGAASVVILGDSITDGHGATTNGNDRWTDVLASRLQANTSTKAVGVSNQGIGGNHLLSDGLGPNALARFDRNVLAPAGVRWVIVFEGVNDLGGLTRTGEVSAAEHAALVERILAAYEQIIVRAHAHGLRVYGATITPYMGSDYYHPGPANELDRQAVNTWIRAFGHFDGVIDFDAIVRDPEHPERLVAAYDCGDHLHPSAKGYKAMGQAIPLGLFAQ